MPARVLVIDDSPVLVELATKGLAAAGLDTSSAMDLASLDEQLARGPYDLILLDVNMPEMYGDDIVEFLRTQRNVKSKFVLYSDLPEAELQKKVAASGATAYIWKGKGLDWTVSEVCRHLGVTPKKPGPTAEAAAPPSPAEPKSEPARKRRVLIVDDSEVTARVLEAELTAKGFEVSYADNAEKATKIILKRQTRPDLVLLDVRMPNVNGEQFCRFIKSNSLFRGIKVLLCSGENPEELQRICRDAGADGYVPKDAVLSKVLTKELT
jgi:CheY-like chemotaxis protein